MSLGGLLLTVLLAYFFNNDWRLLQAVFSVPCILFVSYWWIAPESIRWLMQAGRGDEAR